MLIAVIADTHNRYPPGFLDKLTAAHEIWHLGDVCDPSLLNEIQSVGLRVAVVRGNNDFDFSWPLTLRLERCGVYFHLEHIAPRQPPKGCHVVLHGHTHVPRDETIRGVRWLNPGAVSYANRGAPPSIGWLEFDESEPFRWTIEVL